MTVFPETVMRLAQDATNAQRAGNMAGALKLWTEVLAQAPDHPEALFILGRQAMETKDLPRALDLLRRAALSNPAQPVIPLNIAYVAEAMGDLPAMGLALDAALKADPYFFPALFLKGHFLERIGKPKAAAAVYSNALKIAPPADKLPSSLQAHAARATTVLNAHTDRKWQFLKDRMRAGRSRWTQDDLARFDESVAIKAGMKKAYVHEPVLFHYPELPATCFFPRSRFPWLERLEAHTDRIVEELSSLLQTLGSEFEAYVQKQETEPLNQWAELNKSKRWSALFFWKYGRRVDHICAKAPRTAALLESLPMLNLAGHGPSAFFSALDPHTRIPPHTGVTNVRSIVHLPLIVPENTGFRVGNDSRPFRKGEAWVFDDSIEHEAWNDSGEPRVILIFDIWNPNLSEAERALVADLFVAEDAFEKE
jgi:tetratricopeptide (TPR) repeat protein